MEQEPQLESADREAVAGDYPVSMEHHHRTAEFYSVTDAEINLYASVGWGATFFLSLVGVAFGITVGCSIALVEGGLAARAQGHLESALVGSLGVGALFLILALCAIGFQMKTKRSWTDKDEDDKEQRQGDQHAS